jgi:mRNA-degrading endonuclease toxin of MazEF toxin-antitoxin module
MRRGEIWWADLGAHRPQEQTGRRPVIVWQSDALNRVLHSVLVVPLTTNLDRARLAGTAMIAALRTDPLQSPSPWRFNFAPFKTALYSRIRALTDAEFAELELATDEALGRVDPE